MTGNSDYLKYRGKCKDYVDSAILNDPTLTAEKGWYHCPVWGKQQHWWCVRENGAVFDPTVKQFPTAGAGATYEPYIGIINCEYCDKETKESDIVNYEHHVYCSGECLMKDIGLA